MNNHSFIVINQLKKVYTEGQRPALNMIQAVIPKGTMVGLVGPDGAGKTTLIRLITGLILPTSGEIKTLGFDSVKQADKIHEEIGYMPQKFGLYEDLTVLQNLNLYADLRGVLKEDKKETFENLLRFTNLKVFDQRLAGDLSGGMKQKLGLACALIKKPKLLVLDEPTVGVDPISRRELWKMVQDLLKEGISVLWSTAYLDEAEKCDQVLLLNEGNLLYQGKPSDLNDRVNNRVYIITGITTNRRQVLTECLKQKNVLDGVIQGEDVRIVFKNQGDNLDLLKVAGDKATLKKVKPRFEDAFIDILGGSANGESILAKHLSTITKSDKKVVEANGLTKKFGNFTAADNISFSINQGEIFGLLGPNGAGKSTTFKMMCGLLKPTKGESIVNGLNLQKASSLARSHIGYMAQKFSLYGDLSVLQNLNFFAGIYNLSSLKKEEMTALMISIFNMNEYKNTSSSALPLGFKQRLSLSCAVMHEPIVLFLDEPTSGVDPLTRREFWNHINGLVQKGVTVMVTTHFMDEAEYCDRIGLVYRGKLINLGTPEYLKSLVKNKEKAVATLEDAFIQLIEEYDREYPK